MLDEPKALWLAELIVQAVAHLEHSPGLIIEVSDKSDQWLQIVLEDNDDGQLGGFVLNFPYQLHAGEPVATLRAHGIRLPPNSDSVDWEDGGYATIWVRPDVPLVALAQLASDILERIVGAPPDPELSVQIEYGL